MKIRLSEVRGRHQALCTLGNKKLPIKLSYAIGKNIMALQEELDAVEKARIGLLELYAEKDEDGTFKVKDGHYELGENEHKFNEEFIEFMNTETEIVIYTVSEEIVVSTDNERYDALTPAELISFDFMIEHLEENIIEDVEEKA